MIPVSLKISGFLSYREYSELSFEDFDLACISGANGAGKSSLLDAITWALFGEARRRDDSVINDAVGQAEVIFDFRYENAYYRVQRMKKRNKTTVLEFFIQDGEGHWKPLTEHAISETEKRIADILRMDYETFINASFFLQGKADLFAQQKVADRKRILASILGLEQWERYREAAAAHRKKRELEESTLAGSMEEIEQELAEEGKRREHLEQIEKDLAAASLLRDEKEHSLEISRALVRSLEEQKRIVDGLGEQLEEQEKQLAQQNALLAERKMECGRQQELLQQAARIEKDYAAWRSAGEELKGMESLALKFRDIEGRRNQAVKEIEKEKTRLETEQTALQELQTRFLKTGKERSEVESKLEKLRIQLALLENAVELRDEGEGTCNRLTGEQARLGSENAKLKAEMDELRSRIETLRKNEKAECPLCEQELSTSRQGELLERLEKEGVRKGDQYRKNQAELAEIKKQLSSASEKLEGLKKNERLYQTQQQNLAQLQAIWNGQEETLRQWQEKAEPRLKEIEGLLKSGKYTLEQQAVLKEMEKKTKELGYSEEKHAQLRTDVERLAAAEESMRALEKGRATLEPLERETMGIEQQVANLTIELEKKRSLHEQARRQYEASAASLPDLGSEEANLKQLRQQENALRMEQGGASQKVDVLTALKARLQEFKERQVAIRQELAHIKVLERAYGRDGIPALLIEQSLPDIEERANEILDHLSGGSMSLRFETQRLLKVRDEKKEALAIVVNDAAGQREYELFSGGEAFRVNFAIRLALSHLLTQRSGARLQTLIIDEGFGSQDAEGRQRLIEAINIVRPDFAKILVITHLEELKDAFPTRIEVEKTSMGSKLKVVLA
jgi:exonuclease SbcC